MNSAIKCYISSFATLLISLHSLATTQPGSLVTVGQSPGQGICDYTDIQSAIDGDETNIRVLSNNQFTENITINRDLWIKGGYASCADAMVDIVSSQKTLINGQAVIGNATITLSNTQSINITLENLQVQGAVDTQFIDGGVGIKVQTPGIIDIKNSLITQNQGENGGGIFVDNNPHFTTVNIIDSTVSNNAAVQSGGGLLCQGDLTEVNILGKSLVTTNLAINGGGLAVINGCQVTMDSGEDGRHTNIWPSGVIANTAQLGGGVYLDRGWLFLEGDKHGENLSLGDETKPVTVAFNAASIDGGGVWATNSSNINANNALFYSNEAQQEGGAFLVEEESKVFIKSTHSPYCGSVGACTEISQNKASTGGTFNIKSNAQVSVERSLVRNSEATFGTVASISDSDNQDPPSLLNINNSLIVDNGDIFSEEHFYLTGASRLVGIHNTLVDNVLRSSGSMIFVDTLSSLVWFNSIFNNYEHPVLRQPFISNNLTFNCLLVDNLSNLDSGNGIIEGTMEFVDADVLDFRPAVGSDAIDKCVHTPVFGADYYFQARNIDDPEVINFLGPNDIGAIESLWSEIIFVSNFEGESNE